MTQHSREEILAAALALGADDRERLLRKLILTLDPPNGDDVDDPSVELHPDWEAEIERRERDVDEGRVQLIDGEEAFRQVREMLADRKRLKT